MSEAGGVDGLEAAGEKGREGTPCSGRHGVGLGAQRPSQRRLLVRILRNSALQTRNSRVQRLGASRIERLTCGHDDFSPTPRHRG